MLSRCLTLCDPMYWSPWAPLFMGFTRQEYWSGLPFPSPGDPPNPRTEPGSPALKADALQSEPQGKPLKVKGYTYFSFLTWEGSFISTFVASTVC